MFPANRQRSKGAILPMMAVGIVTLVGISALVLDLGRLFVLKTEMQNAADAAALAAAAELDGNAGAFERAVAAAKGRLEHLTNQAQVQELLANLDETWAPGADAGDYAFVFYSYIGSNVDPDAPPADCIVSTEPEYQVAGSKTHCVVSTDPADAHYVKVRLNPETSTTGSYVVDLFFLPVLRVFGVEAADEASTVASAVAGSRYQYICEYPPMMICNPFEGTKSMAEAVQDGDINVGDGVRLQDKGLWSPGNFGFLQPFEDGDFKSGAKDLGDGIANPEDQECTTMLVKTQPGTIESHPNWAMNTRFDIQSHGYNAPPAPNIMAYYEDTCLINGTCTSVDPRFGDGEWKRSDYWNEYHHPDLGHPAFNSAVLDADGDGVVTRWEVYNWEISSGWMPCNETYAAKYGPPPVTPACPTMATPMTCGENGVCGRPNSYPLTSSLPAQGNDLEPVINNPPVSPLEPRVGHGYPRWGVGESFNLNRRIIYVAVLNCEAQGITGNKEGEAQEIAKFFLLERALQGNSLFDYAAEFLGMATVDTDPDVIHEVIQLYE